jgi:lysozyme
MIHCNHNYYMLYLKEIMPDKCKLWIVDYQHKPDCNWTFWQTTSKFKLDGIKGHVDLNLFNGTKQNLESLLF